MRTREDYRHGWAQYRLGWIAVDVLAITWIPTMLFMFHISYDLTWVVAFFYVVLLTVLQLRLLAWRCPRYDNFFADNWLLNRIYWMRNCAHCGLPKYAKSNPDVKHF